VDSCNSCNSWLILLCQSATFYLTSKNAESSPPSGKRPKNAQPAALLPLGWRGHVAGPRAESAKWPCHGRGHVQSRPGDGLRRLGLAPLGMAGPRGGASNTAKHPLLKIRSIWGATCGDFGGRITFAAQFHSAPGRPTAVALEGAALNSRMRSYKLPFPRPQSSFGPLLSRIRGKRPFAQGNTDSGVCCVQTLRRWWRGALGLIELGELTCGLNAIAVPVWPIFASPCSEATVSCYRRVRSDPVPWQGPGLLPLHSPAQHRP
jgi:hypothetical protein